MTNFKKRLHHYDKKYSRSNTKLSTEPQKDSVYAWCLVACVLFCRAMLNGLLHSWGSFLIEFVREFNASKATAAWVGSVAYGLSMTFGPITSILVNRYGCRPVMVSGCVLCGIAVFVSSFVSSLSQMFGTFSFIYGIGACMSISPTMTIAPEYFDKYMTVAVGLMTAGSSLGTLIMAPLSQALIDALGWRNTFRIYTGTCFFSALCCCIIRPMSSAKKSPIQRIKMSPARHLMQEIKLWKNRVFVVWTLAITCVMFGFYIPYVHLVSYAKDVGIPPEKGSILLMILGACTAVGRIMFGKIVASGILNRLHMHQLSMFVTGSAVMLLPLIKTFTGVILYVVTIGLVDGCYVVLLPVLTVSLMAGENTVTAWGFLVGTSSITFTLGPPVAGALYDSLGSYDVAFHCAGIPVIMGGLILFLIPWAQRTSQTNNIMVVVSEEAIANEYDFADDLIKEGNDTRDEPTGSSKECIVNDTSCGTTSVPYSKMKYSKLYKDQSTSTSPESMGYIPRDVNEAVSMLRENARLIAEMLGSKVVVPENINPVSKSSTKSKSEMIQSSIIGHHPSKVISIMSIPGGLTISQWEPNETEEKDANTATDSLNIPLSVPPSQTQLSAASSYQSRNFILEPFSDSSVLLLPTSSQLYQTSTCIPPDTKHSVPGSQSSSSRVPMATVSPSGLENLNMFDQTIENQVGVLMGNLSSQLNEKKLEDESEHQRTINPIFRASIQGTSVNISSQSPSIHVVSPRSIPTSPTLSAIPEVTVPALVINGTVEEQMDIDTDKTLKDNFLQHCSNVSMKDDHVNPSLSTSPRMESSLSDAVQSNSSECNRVSRCCSPAGEIDVFTHLFDDHDSGL